MTEVSELNTKRQRRPNVRLGEIGDVSAAVLCGTSQRYNENWGDFSWKSKMIGIQGKPRIPSDMLTSAKMRKQMQLIADSHGERNSSDEGIGGVRTSAGPNIKQDDLDPSPTARKSRRPKMRGRGVRGSGFGDRVRKSSRDIDVVKGEGGNQHGGHGFSENVVVNDSYDMQEQDKDSDMEASGSPHYAKGLTNVSKDASPDAVVVNVDRSLSPHVDDEWNEPISDRQVQAESEEYMAMDDGFKDNNGLSSDDNNCMELPSSVPSRLKNENSGGLRDQRMGSVDRMNTSLNTKFSDGEFSSVDKWLDKLGYSKYAHIFEAHEVDKDVLPFLTFEDLKEMGINAVGPRRKIFTAIKLLREELST